MTKSVFFFPCSLETSHRFAEVCCYTSVFNRCSSCLQTQVSFNVCVVYSYCKMKFRLDCSIFSFFIIITISFTIVFFFSIVIAKKVRTYPNGWSSQIAHWQLRLYNKLTIIVRTVPLSYAEVPHSHFPIPLVSVVLVESFKARDIRVQVLFIHSVLTVYFERLTL